MAAYNVVRFRVKPGNEQRFVDYHRTMRDPKLKGFMGGSLIKTGDQTFCMVGEWRSFQNIVNARPQMIGMLDGTRDMLEDLGGGLGVTDPVSGQVVVRFGVPRPAKKRAAKKRATKKRAAKPRRAAKRTGKRTAKKGKKR